MKTGAKAGWTHVCDLLPIVGKPVVVMTYNSILLGALSRSLRTWGVEGGECFVQVCDFWQYLPASKKGFGEQWVSPFPEAVGSFAVCFHGGRFRTAVRTEEGWLDGQETFTPDRLMILGKRFHQRQIGTEITPLAMYC